MADMLSQEEINALLGEAGADSEPAEKLDLDAEVAPEQRDVLGEVGNISMGTAATTLSLLLNQKVNIDTPQVTVCRWKDLPDKYARPCVGIRVNYKEGLEGANILILKERDVKIITNLMMGGDGTIDEDAPLSDIDMSAIGEAMNQMVGSASTSISSMLKAKIDIDTPVPFNLDFSAEDAPFFEKVPFEPEEVVVCISFRLTVGDLIDSEITQTLPKEFALQMAQTMAHNFGVQSDAAPSPPPAAAPPPPAAAPPPPVTAPPPAGPPYQEAPQMTVSTPAQQTYTPPPVNAQPVTFQSFDMQSLEQEKKNMEIIRDVPLEVTVELGRTHKKIREILEFAPGTIVELDKLASEPIDILVNGKFVAKGEVVVIDENFGVRITDIISPEHRI